MKKIKRAAGLLPVVILLALLLAASAQAAVDSRKLLDARTAKCWVEGEVVDKWVLGARGSIEFVYMDLALSQEMIGARKKFNDAVISSYPYESWLEEGHVYFGHKEAKGRAVFLAYVTANKPWDFDFTQVRVGAYRLTKNDILTPSWSNPFGELPSDLEGWFVFVVPKSEVKPGQTVQLGYGDYTVEWKAPK